MVGVELIAQQGSQDPMRHVLHHLRSILAAVTILALSAGLAFGAAPAASWGLANAASHAGKTVPVAGAGDTLEEDETESDEESDTDEDSDTEEADEEEETESEDETTEEDGANCATDPTVATEEELAELNHGSIVCWAAHQTEWPEWFENHGQWVRCWAHHGKADATSCTEDPNAEGSDGGDETAEDSTVEAQSAGPGKGKAGGKGKANGKGKGRARQD
jgi:hypothetical protein